MLLLLSVYSWRCCSVFVILLCWNAEWGIPDREKPFSCGRWPISLLIFLNILTFCESHHSSTSSKSLVTLRYIFYHSFLLVIFVFVKFLVNVVVFIVSLFNKVKLKESLWFTEVWPWCGDLASAWATSGPGGGQQCQKPTPAVGQHPAPNCQQRGPKQLPDPSGEALIHYQYKLSNSSSLFCFYCVSDGRKKIRTSENSWVDSRTRFTVTTIWSICHTVTIYLFCAHNNKKLYFLCVCLLYRMRGRSPPSSSPCALVQQWIKCQSPATARFLATRWRRRSHMRDKGYLCPL